MSLEHVLMIFISFHNAKIYLKFLDFPKLCGRPSKDLSQIFQVRHRNLYGQTEEEGKVTLLQIFKEKVSFHHWRVSPDIEEIKSPEKAFISCFHVVCYDILNVVLLPRKK